MTQEDLNIICVLQQPDLALRLPGIFPDRRVRVTLEKSIDKIVERFEQQAYDVFIFSSAAEVSEDKDSIELLELITSKCPATQILYLVEIERLHLAMSALKAGSYQYAKLPISNQGT